MLSKLLKTLAAEDGFTPVGILVGVLCIILAFALAAGTHSILFLFLVIVGVLAIIFL